jgi:hypothetical protein
MLILLVVTDSTRSTHDFLFKINKPGKMENQNMIDAKKTSWTPGPCGYLS